MSKLTKFVLLVIGVKTLVAGILLLVYLLDLFNPKLRKMQYMPDMADTPIVKAQEAPISAPDNSVAMNGVHYAETLEEADGFYPAPDLDDELVAQGKELYLAFCSMCHGEHGQGNGIIAEKFGEIPSLISEEVTQKSDGYIFHVISQGKNRMPSYGHSILENERWSIIKYVRDELEKK